MDTPKTSRREFCAHAMSLVTVASLIEGCGSKGGGPTGPGGGGVPNTQQLANINAAVQGGTVTLTVDPGSPLSPVGSAALVRSSAGVFLVTRIAENSFNALTAVCTHEQCEVTGFASGTFVCPCHGSQYTTAGTVQAGPATRNLQRFNTSFTNNVLTITV